MIRRKAHHLWIHEKFESERMQAILQNIIEDNNNRVGQKIDAHFVFLLHVKCLGAQ